ncbi:Rhs-family protein [Lysobacter capsici AZ78]|uniref:Rhs-family protein n=1 Tax=Lysobacter capsici AZ78 TaxID=1444315 RepID=A0A108U9S1_9GAMM|nr:Rhs-family protein [Lysobacter capsici AZ78]
MATGNLIVQGQDEQLFGNGFLASQMRTYNSRGFFGEFGSDGWNGGFETRAGLRLLNVLNTRGSQVQQLLGDGSMVYYDYDEASGDYISTVGDGAHDRFRYIPQQTGQPARWQWTDGNQTRREQYFPGTLLGIGLLDGRLSKTTDLKTGAEYTFVYDDQGRLQRIDGSNGDALVFEYDRFGSRLLGLSTVEGGVARSQIRYGYDNQGRLTRVESDLTPGDWSDNAGNPARSFVTTYSYEQSSQRLARIVHSDGTESSYTYYTSGAANGRVRTVSSGRAADGSLQTLTFSYDLQDDHRRTDVSDASGRTWTYGYDAAGQLIQVQAPAIDGLRDVTDYQYDAAGNVIRVSTQRGGQLLSRSDFSYDANGNLLWQWEQVDPAQGGAARAVQRTYTAANQLASETVFSGLDADGVGTAQAPGGGLTTRFVYDASNRLRYAIDATGAVEERTYHASGNGSGQVASTRRYLGAAYVAADASLAALDAWATAAQRAQSVLVESHYDVAGRLSRTLAYAQLDANGAGIVDDAAELIDYVYDAQGLLRQKIVQRSATAAANDGRDSVETTAYGYDGIGRMLSETVSERVGTGAVRVVRTTAWVHQDNGNILRTTLEGGPAGDGVSANDQLRTELRNASGQLIATTVSAVSGGETRTSRNYYDGTGRLRASEDASGARVYFFYDAEGALAGEVDVQGTVTAYVRDGLGRVVRTTVHEQRVDTSSWLVNGAVVPVDFAAVRPAAGANDRSVLASYDALGRLLSQTDAEGTVTRHVYDGANRLIETRVHAAANDAPERVLRYLRDALGREVGRLDAEGFLVETRYDRAGRVEATIAYAAATPDAARAAGDLAALRPLAHADDQLTRYFHDGRGNRIGVLDAEGALTEAVFDEARNERAVRVYHQRIASPAGNESFAQLRAQVQAGGTRETRRQFDALGQLRTELDPEGTLSRYSYDAQGRLLKTERAVGTSEVREGHRRYDVFGNLIGELDGEGATRLLPGMSEAQLDAIYAQYGVRHGYDVLGRRTESVDAEGNKTWYFYDVAGRPTFTVHGVQDAAGVRNGAGEVSETRYTNFGQVGETIAYTGRILIAAPHDRARVDDAVRALQFVAAQDSRHRFVYDRRGQLTEHTDAEGAVIRNRYNGFGELATQWRDLGAGREAETRYAYDRRGQWLSQTEQSVGAAADGSLRSVSRGFDAFGRVATATDARGHSIQYGYDRLGRQISQRQSVSGREEMASTAYDVHGRVLTQTDALGRVTRYAYDEATRSATVTTPEGISTTSTRNRFGETVRVTDGLGRVTTFDYDRDGLLLKTTDALNGESRQQFDARGLMIRSVDAAGRVVRFVYDARGRAIERTEDPDGLALTQRTVYDGQGRSVSVTDAAGVRTALSYDRQGRLIEQVHDADGLALRTTYAWNTRGQQVRVTTGAGTAEARTVEYGYDALGRRVRETIAPGVLDLTTTYAYDGNDNLVARTDAAGRVTRYTYDEADRQRFAIDGEGGVAETAYDANGRVVAVRAYANVIDLSGLPLSIDSAQVQARLRADDARDVQDYRVYDRDGRVRLRLDGAGAVAETVYDAANQATAVTRYANAKALDPGLRAQLWAGTADIGGLLAGVAADPARDQSSYSVRDALGRERLSIDATGAVTETAYDPVGRALRSVRYANAWPLDDGRRAQLRAGTLDADTVLSSLAADPARDRSVALVYDRVGRLRYTLTRTDTDRAVVSESRFDAVGRVVAQIQYGVTIGFNPASSEADVTSALSAALAADPARQRSTHTVYDAAGRARFAVDAVGAVTEMRYDATGLVVQSVRYQQARAFNGANLADLVAWTQSQPAGEQRISTTLHDAAGRASVRTDALNRSETITYDGSGQVLSVTNRDGHRWTYEYDAAGRKRAEISPPVAVAMADAAGNVGVVMRSVIARIAYDGQGNVIARTDNADTAQARTTVYVYDNRGHQVRTVFPDAGRIDPASGELVASGRAPSIDVVYDTLGRAVVQRDVRGHYSYKTYDLLGRLAAEVDQEGYVTAYAYDALGEQTGLTRYAHPIGAGLLGAGQPIDRAQLLGALIASDRDRSLSTTYDQRGHKTSVVQSVVSVVNADGSVVSIAPAKRFVYDAYGDLVKESEQLDAARWADTYRYYDALGRLTLSVDPEGYVSAQRYNTTGEVVESIEYARAVDTAALGTAQPPALPAAGDAAIGYDRSTRRQYDALGRKVSETVTRHTHDANGVSGVRDVVTTIGYDGEGHAVRVDVDGQATTTVFDALGRSVSVLEAERDAIRADAYDQLRNVGVDLNSAGLTERVSPYSTMVYDAFGNLVQLHRYANGWRSGEAAPQAAANDTLHTTRYDLQGRAVWERDSAGTVYIKQYDEADNLIEVRSRLDGNQGRSAVIVVATSYDRSGRQTLTLTTRELYQDDQFTGIARDAAAQVRYNAFGEILAKDSRTDTALATEQFAVQYVYDAAGRVVASNAEGGQWRRYGYNAAGHLQTTAQAMRLGGADGALVDAVTSQVTDRLGRVIEQTQPAFGDDLNQRPRWSQRLDRWGNALESVDTRGGITVSVYNEANQLVRQTRPEVVVVHRDGSQRVERPENAWFYDALGRLLGIRDANGYLRQQSYDAAGRLIAGRDATGHVTRMAYDALGQQVLTQDPLGHLTFRLFDAAGRIAGQGDYLINSEGTARDWQLREVYRLNQRGDRIAVTDITGQSALYDYDSRGLVVRSRSNAGVTMSYGFDANGRKIRETNALSDPSLIGGGGGRRTRADEEGEVVYLDEQTWDYDDFGRLIDHNDLSGADCDYDYDPSTGQLNVQHRAGAAARETIYYANGLVKELREGDNWFRYAYDAAGNRIREETYTRDGAGQRVHMLTRAEYDAHNRVVRVSQDEMGAAWNSGDPPPNADFERGDEGWTKQEGWSIKQALDGADTLSGGWAAEFNGFGPSSLTSNLRARVQPGQVINASVMIQQGASSAGDAAARVLIIWFDADGNMLLGGEGLSWAGGNLVDSGSNGNWHPSSVTATVPPGAVTMAIAVSAKKNSNDPLWVDDFRWSYEPVAGDSQSAPGKRLLDVHYGYDAVGNRRKIEAATDYGDPNLAQMDEGGLFNGGFEHGDAGWEKDNGWSIVNNDPGTGYKGSKFSARFNLTASDARITYKAPVPVRAGERVTLSAAVQQGASSEGEAGAKVFLYWLDANGNRLSPGTTLYGSMIDSGSGGRWHTSSLTTLVPPGAAYMKIGGEAFRTGGNDPLWIDDFRWSFSVPNGDFIDGDTGWSVKEDGWRIVPNGPPNPDFSAAFFGPTAGRIYSDARPVLRPGQWISASAMVQRNSSRSGGGVFIHFLDANGNGVSVARGTMIESGSGWQESELGPVQVPPGAVTMVIGGVAYTNGSSAIVMDRFTWQYARDEDTPGTPTQSPRYNAPEALKTYWYDYDAENRVTVAHGKLVNGQIVLGNPDVSYGLAYDGAGRAVYRRFLQGQQVMQELTQYDQRGQRQLVFMAQPLGGGAPVELKERYVYDALGRLSQRLEYFDADDQRKDIPVAGWIKHAETYEYDADGRVLRQYSYGRPLQWTPDPNTPPSARTDLSSLALISEVDYARHGYDAAGRQRGYAFVSHALEDSTGALPNDPVGYTQTYTYTYEGRESYLETVVHGTSSNSNFKATTTTSHYDGWGRRLSVREHTPGQDVDDKLRYLSFDGDGNILRRREGHEKDGAFQQFASESLQTQTYAYLAGQHIASGKFNGDVDLLGRMTAYQSSEVGVIRIPVQAGDTLRRIAGRVYGNENLWYVLAEANALGADTELTAGTTIKVPDVKVTANDANTFKPFDPSEAIGSTTPNLPYIEPPPKNQCNAIAAVLAIVIVAVAYVFAPYIGPVVQSVLGTGALATGVTAGVATVAASTVVRGAASAIGVASFSWRDVAVDGITAGVTAGAGSYLAGTATFGKVAADGSRVLNTAGRVAQGMASYGGSVVANATVGRDTYFSWKGLAATAAGAYLGAKLNPSGSLPITDGSSGFERFANDFAGSALDGAINATVRRSMGLGKQNWGQIAVDAFGNALRNAIEGGIDARRARQAQLQLELEALSADNPFGFDGVADRFGEWDADGSSAQTSTLNEEPAISTEGGITGYDVLDKTRSSKKPVASVATEDELKSFYDDFNDPAYIKAESVRKAQVRDGYPEVKDAAGPTDVPALFDSIDQEFKSDQLSLFRTEKRPGMGGKPVTHLVMIEKGTNEYAEALKQTGEWRVKELVDHVNELRRAIKARGRPEDIQAWNNLGVIGIEINAPNGYGAQADYNKAISDPFIVGKSTTFKQVGGSMIFNDGWFFNSQPGHKSFVVAHEFRHTMYVNNLYENVVLPRSGVGGGWPANSGYESTPKTQATTTSRNHEGEARRWAAELVGYLEYK